ncbi:endo alpha-1,4 polygalactosaminidase [Micromonospora sp. NPDC048830]|uniref:endo alpha-1,4 polygalactosaminidase n=1 Tax=Micromonospora sp. NPDC048830 TaxID=3364257 RepID=UPI003720AB9F
MAKTRARYLTGIGVVVLAVVLGLVAALSPRAQASTTAVTATQLTTTTGRTGQGQPVTNLAEADLTGTTDDWNRYVEFIGRYSGYLTFVAPPDVSPREVTAVDVRVNYRGPDPETQTWTFALFDWAASGWVRVGTNGGAPHWGPWTSLAWPGSAPYAWYMSPTGELRLQITSNNRRDAADLDYVAISLTSTPGQPAPSGGASSPSASTPPPPSTQPHVPTSPPATTPTTAPPSPSTRPVTTTGSVRCPDCWRPPLQVSWNWVIAGVPKPPFRDVDIYDIDGFDASSADVAALHRAGIRVVCYISAGSYEDWRPDAGQFPASLLGRNLDGWAGERWLDVRGISPTSPLARIMTARIDMCRAKGFDAVEFDNMDGYINRTGFPLTAADQLAYNRFLANTAHARGLSTVLKNDLDQIDDLVDYFDMALNEECSRYNECGEYQPFIAAGKPVLHAEYGSSTAFCQADNAANINGVLFSLDLDDSVYRPCR